MPARALGELARIAQSAEGETLDVGVQENQVVFGVDGVMADGAPHRRAVPELQAAAARRPSRPRSRLPREEFLDVVRRTSRHGAAQLAAAAALRRGRADRSSAQTQDVGEARESLPIAYTGDALEIGFNPEFLRDGLESVVRTSAFA